MPFGPGLIPGPLMIIGGGGGGPLMAGGKRLPSQLAGGMTSRDTVPTAVSVAGDDAVGAAAASGTRPAADGLTGECGGDG